MALALFTIVGAFIFAGWVIYTVLFLAPWFPTRKHDIDRIDAALAWRPDTLFYDLGSGDGRVCLWLARRHPDVTFVGVEMSFVLHAIAVLRCKISGLTNVRCMRADALRLSLLDADYVYVFGTHRTIDTIIRDKVVPQVKLGTHIISYNFGVTQWSGDEVCYDDDGFTRFYIYTK